MTAIGGKITNRRGSNSNSNGVRRGSNGMQDESVKFHARDFLVHKQEDLLQDYDLGDMLGEGGFGLVYSCIHKSTGAERAVKILRKDPTRPNYNENIINEFNVLKELDHPVRYYCFVFVFLCIVILTVEEMLYILEKQRCYDISLVSSSAVLGCIVIPVSWCCFC